LGGEWVKNKDPRGIRIVKLNAYLYVTFWLLTYVIKAWKFQNIDYLKEDYYLMLDAKLPMTENQMIAFSDILISHTSKGREKNYE
jgi:hypothetical protein